jgi:hypothetical protein
MARCKYGDVAGMRRSVELARDSLERHVSQTSTQEGDSIRLKPSAASSQPLDWRIRPPDAGLSTGRHAERDSRAVAPGSGPNKDREISCHVAMKTAAQLVGQPHEEVHIPTFSTSPTKF